MAHVAAVADSEAKCGDAHGSEFGFLSFVEDDDGNGVVATAIGPRCDERILKSRQFPGLARGQEAAIVVDVVRNVVFVHCLLLLVLLVFAEIATKVTHAPAIHSAPDA